MLEEVWAKLAAAHPPGPFLCLLRPLDKYLQESSIFGRRFQTGPGSPVWGSGASTDPSFLSSQGGHLRGVQLQGEGDPRPVCSQNPEEDGESLERC